MNESQTSTLLVETHSPADANGSECLQLARALLDAGGSVHLHLMQDGVTWLQQCPLALQALAAAHGDRLAVTADDLSLALRGIPPDAASGRLRLWAAGDLVTAMARPGIKTIWHS